VVLVEPGHLDTATGHPALAREHWQAAHHILTDLGSPEVDGVRPSCQRTACQRFRVMVAVAQVVVLWWPDVLSEGAGYASGPAGGLVDRDGRGGQGE
jgi:hypothetical protein